jgi:hypothetical protein
MSIESFLLFVFCLLFYFIIGPVIAMVLLVLSGLRGRR